MCGENSAVTDVHLSPNGSSPRVRGKLATLGPAASGDGLIPACAGKTSRHSIQPAHAQAHPRVCGENSAVTDVHLSPNGSSPRVRGKLQVERLGDSRQGLIPACAGKTRLR